MLLLLTTLLSLTLPERVDRMISEQLRADSVSASSVPLLPFAREIDAIAERYHLPPALLAALVQEESRFDPLATRAEPAYAKNASIRRASIDWSNAHRGLPTAYTEHLDRARSYGLMQIMGETAREQGFTARYLAALYDPSESLSEGAKLLRRLLTRYRNDTLAAISAYNQGSARRSRGIFLNARYVYRVTIAWHVYDSYFTANRRKP